MGRRRVRASELLDQLRGAADDGRLQWAEGSYPTPKGPIRVRHERQADGSVKSEIQLPEGIERVGN